jgi:exodeoxyribonuclease V alpha subunit
VTRELLYTGVTRAREAFTLITSRREALHEAITQTTRRSSGIEVMLREAISSPSDGQHDDRTASSPR